MYAPKSTVILYLLISPSYDDTFSNRTKKSHGKYLHHLRAGTPIGQRSQSENGSSWVANAQDLCTALLLVHFNVNILCGLKVHMYKSVLCTTWSLLKQSVALTLLAKPLPKVQMLWNIAPRYTDLLQGELIKITSTLNLPILRDVSSYHNGRLRSMTGRVTVGVQLWAWPWGTCLWQGVKWLGSFIHISTMYDSSLKRTIELCHILNGNCLRSAMRLWSLKRSNNRTYTRSRVRLFIT